MQIAQQDINRGQALLAIYQLPLGILGLNDYRLQTVECSCRRRAVKVPQVIQQIVYLRGCPAVAPLVLWNDKLFSTYIGDGFQFGAVLSRGGGLSHKCIGQGPKKKSKLLNY